MIKKRVAKKAVINPTEPLHVALRPTSLKQVIGQDAVVESLGNIIETKGAKTFLFTGPSGVGKTTLARIVARKLGCEPDNLWEVDGATTGGIDAIRDVIEGLSYLPMTQSQVRAVVVDECHALSKPAWQSLLKALEEPKQHVYWMLCTTEVEKVPETIKTRCHHYGLKPVRWDLLSEYLTAVNKEQRLGVDEEIIDMAAKRANGSVRQALVFLSAVRGISDKEKAAALMEYGDERKEIIDFVKYMIFGNPNWKGAAAMLRSLKEQEVSPESIRMVMVNFLAAVILNSKSEGNTKRLLTMLAAFSEAYNSNEKYAPLLLSTASVLMED